MKIYEYRDYQDYVEAQTEANHRKIRNVWISQKNVQLIHAHFGPDARAVLCHGTRNGTEQLLFHRIYPAASVLGTEISDTAKRFPYTLQWDMQLPRKEWINIFDIVYTNSFDHAIYPRATISVWLNQLNEHGVLYLDHAHDPRVNYASRQDPLEVSESEMVDLVASAGGSVGGMLSGISSNGVSTCIYCIRPK